MVNQLVSNKFIYLFVEFYLGVLCWMVDLYDVYRFIKIKYGCSLYNSNNNSMLLLCWRNFDKLWLFNINKLELDFVN